VCPTSFLNLHRFGFIFRKIKAQLSLIGGMAFDPKSKDRWLQENSDDAFSEINRVEPGMNGGWIQIMGPSESALPNSKRSN
jgi:hypothetical protein